ncbi:MAG: MCE family protein, partial [Rhodococcus sp. (in: high G+C Gram-positive bacteria)]
MRPTTIKFLIFTLTMVLVFAGLAVVFSQARFTGKETYHAAFT